MAVALPVGWAADKTARKSRIIAFGGLLTPLAAASTTFAVIYGVERARQAESGSGDAMGDFSSGGDPVVRLPSGERDLLYAIFLASMCAWGV
eukprot:7228025-Prymnesium_polylepis.1